MSNTLYTEINLAAERFDNAPVAPHRTASDYSIVLSQLCDAEVFLKQEHMQITGSFKYRGALNTLLCLSDSERQKGVIAASSGNHGMATAMACRTLGVPAHIYVPETVSPTKLAKIQALGAEVKLIGEDCLVSETAARNDAEKTGRTYISPYNDWRVVHGQGTIGKELHEQLPELDAVFIAVGGGGMTAGIGSYLKHVNPAIEIFGCWPEAAHSMKACLDAGKVIDVPEKDTLSDGTAGGLEEDAITFEVCQKVIDNTVLVSEAQIADAMKLMVEKEQQIVEGAAGVAIAAAIESKEKVKGKKVAIIVCGRNVSTDVIHSIL